MFVAEKKLAFSKLPVTIHHVEKQGVKFGSDVKVHHGLAPELMNNIF